MIWEKLKEVELFLLGIISSFLVFHFWEMILIMLFWVVLMGIFMSKEIKAKKNW
jgi:hypothetical protein